MHVAHVTLLRLYSLFIVEMTVDSNTPANISSRDRTDLVQTGHSGDMNLLYSAFSWYCSCKILVYVVLHYDKKTVGFVAQLSEGYITQCCLIPTLNFSTPPLRKQGASQEAWRKCVSCFLGGGAGVCIADCKSVKFTPYRSYKHHYRCAKMNGHDK